MGEGEEQLARSFEEHRGHLKAVAYGAPGLVGVADGRVGSVLTATVHEGRITALYVLADPERLRDLTLPDEEDAAHA
ncbi:hypothetical protein OG837_02770 [Streptomyces cellulosae]|nr:hypothetical protein OG837_02770 [Streptomyces cellulosae]